MYICGRTANVRFRVAIAKNLRYRRVRVFQAADEGHFESGSVCPVGWELLMPQPLVRHIARRAVQGAIVAAGILVVLLVFSRQAHAAISTPSAATSASSTPAPAASASSAVTSAAAPVTSAVSAVTSAPAVSASSSPAPAASSSSA